MSMSNPGVYRVRMPVLSAPGYDSAQGVITSSSGGMAGLESEIEELKAENATVLAGGQLPLADRLKDPGLGEASALGRLIRREGKPRQFGLNELDRIHGCHPLRLNQRHGRVILQSVCQNKVPERCRSERNWHTFIAHAEVPPAYAC